MYKLTLPMEVVKRFSTYVSKIEEFEIPNFSKSDYWKYQSKLIKVNITGNQITLDGSSGCYTPSKKGQQLKVTNNLIKLAKNPDKLITYIKQKNKTKNKKSKINLLNYFDAFDAVMCHESIADVDLAPYRINFKKLKEEKEVFPSINAIKEKYFAKDKYELSQKMAQAYYLYNIIFGFIKNKKIKTFLEIGAGNGNLASLIYYYAKPQTIIVDLPETLCLSIPFIADLFPRAKILMPHEADLYEPETYDFVFLTPSQIDIIKSDSVDLAINVCSFQEMTHKQIEVYFELVQRCCKNDGYFLAYNRVEKIPGGVGVFEKGTCEPANRFADYPWNPVNDILIYEICRFSRLVQLDDVYIRLEQIKK